MSGVRVELESLRAALVQTPPAAGEPPEAARPQPEIEVMLNELRDTLADAAGDAGAAIGRHPAVAISAAFLLGVLVGRTAGRL